MKRRRVMIDGVLAGVELNGAIAIEGTEIDKIRKILIKNGAEEKEGGLSITVQGKSDMVIAIRNHYHDKKRAYLNISGNPLTFLKGDNDYGYAEADRVIITAYRKALDTLKGTIPKRVLTAIAERKINLHSLEFATYTCVLKNKKKLLNDWAHVYSSAYSTPDGKTHTTLADMLDLKFVRKHKSHKSSVCLRIMSKDGHEEEAMLMAYDKALEIRAKSSIGVVMAVPTDIENRIRLDLNLNYGWFRRRQVNGVKLKTLADLVNYVGKKHEGNWVHFLAHEFEWALTRTCLFHMWAFDAQAVMKKRCPSFPNTRLNLNVYNAMLKARSFLPITDAEWNKVIKSGQMKRSLCHDPHPERLTLDMEEL